MLDNFKSYFGTKEIGPLHKYFSAVVGPNGSGKSNLIESLLFVFGYRAKKMRLNKLSELIHNSALHNNIEKASVEVHFQEIIDDDNDIDLYIPVAGSDFILSRTVDKNSNSKYMISNKDTTFHQVSELLKSKGIDLDHNRFLILQGEVESISTMKPKGANTEEGLLEYIEEVVDTKKYISRLTELEDLITNKDQVKKDA